MAEETGHLQDLERTYCPPLDPALLSAVVFDFNLTNPAEVSQLRDVLDALRTAADEQQDLPFDPSGTSGLGISEPFSADTTASDCGISRNEAPRSPETDITSLDSSFSSLSITQGAKEGKDYAPNSRPSRPDSYVVDFNGPLSLTSTSMDENAKMTYLTEMFPSVDTYTVTHTLKKYGQDVERSMDVLLNLVFFEEQGPADDGETMHIPKGVDGFAREPVGGNGKKGAKNKRRKAKNDINHIGVSSDLSSQHHEAIIVNKWDTVRKDVDLIHSRTSPYLRREVIASAHHAHGASLSETIKHLALSHAPRDEQETFGHPVLAVQVAELSQELPNVPPTTLTGLLKITGNSISAAKELAIEMLNQSTSPRMSDFIGISVSAPAIDTDIDTNGRGPPPSATTAGSLASPSSAHNAVRTHLIAGADAFTKASAAYRRSRSDRLMGGAAAYYSAVGRDYIEKARMEASAAADALVDAQSSAHILDLHGVTVQDAMRIARIRVAQWWESLGDTKYLTSQPPARDSYRVITGIGRHSRGGTPKLGPAVCKVLTAEGWKVEVGEGVLLVTGMVRHR